MIYWRAMSENMKRKEESAFARMLLEDALKKEYGMEILPEIQTNEFGKPFFTAFPDIHFNYSHTKNAAACVLSDSEAGIDLERVRRYNEKTARRFCSDKEWNWLQNQENMDSEWIRIWTRKEAYVKYLGKGIRMDLRSVDTFDVLRENKQGQNGGTPDSAGEIQMQSFFIEDSWLTVCGFFKETETICCI